MNNSKIALDNIEEDDTSFLEKRRGELTQVVEAINGVEASADWQKLKKLVLDGLVGILERQLQAEANKKEINTAELYRLQGQLMWAKKYVDLKRFGEFFKQEIEGIKSKLNNDKIPRDGAL